MNYGTGSPVSNTETFGKVAMPSGELAQLIGRLVQETSATFDNRNRVQGIRRIAEDIDPDEAMTRPEPKAHPYSPGLLAALYDALENLQRHNAETRMLLTEIEKAI